MTTTIKSQTHDTRYFLTIDEQAGRAEACTCGDYQYRQAARGGACKHMKAFNAEADRAATFILLRQRFDSRLNGQEQAKRFYYELSMGL